MALPTRFLKYVSALTRDNLHKGCASGAICFLLHVSLVRNAARDWNSSLHSLPTIVIDVCVGHASTFTWLLHTDSSVNSSSITNLFVSEMRTARFFPLNIGISHRNDLAPRVQ